MCSHAISVAHLFALTLIWLVGWGETFEELKRVQDHHKLLRATRVWHLLLTILMHEDYVFSFLECSSPIAGNFVLVVSLRSRRALWRIL